MKYVMSNFNLVPTSVVTFMIYLYQDTFNNATILEFSQMCFFLSLHQIV